MFFAWPDLCLVCSRVQRCLDSLVLHLLGLQQHSYWFGLEDALVRHWFMLHLCFVRFATLSHASAGIPRFFVGSLALLVLSSLRGF